MYVSIVCVYTYVCVQAWAPMLEQRPEEDIRGPFLSLYGSLVAASLPELGALVSLASGKPERPREPPIFTSLGAGVITVSTLVFAYVCVCP